MEKILDITVGEENCAVILDEERQSELDKSVTLESILQSEINTLTAQLEPLQKAIAARKELIRIEKEHQCQIEGHKLGGLRQEFDHVAGISYGETYRVCGRCNEKIYASTVTRRDCLEGKPRQYAK